MASSSNNMGITSPQSVSAQQQHPQFHPHTTTNTSTYPTHHHYPTKSAAAVDAERDDDDDDDVNKYNSAQNNNNSNSYLCQYNRNSNKWECNNNASEYKAILLQQVMDNNEYKDGSRATIDQLKEFGITVYLAEYGSVDMHLLQQVVQHVSASKLDRTKSQYENQRCLLYRDESGRLYNLTINNGCEGLAATWKSLLLSFSGLQAMTALVVLTRAYACAGVAESILKPGYLSLILGLILYEEISYVG